uniref:Uncharacterized protein n=1 Tax=candidate division CPR3 bacterium TaxID=2268181 RepID=A0A7C4M1D4_UNCC3
MKKIKYFTILFVLLFLSTFVFGNIFTKADSVGFDTFDSSSGQMSGGSYILDSSLGQTVGFSASGGDYVLYSGFQQGFTAGTYISIAIDFPSGGEAILSDISGFFSGATGVGYADVTVTTDYDGYSLAIKSATSPALKCNPLSGCDEGDSFSNYTPSGGLGNPDYLWSISDSSSAFGFTPKGVDILSKYKYDTNTQSCGSGLSSFVGDYCWDGLSTTDTDIAFSSGSNHPDGAVTRIKLRSQVGSDKIQPSGSYEADITLTAVANL